MEWYENEKFNYQAWESKKAGAGDNFQPENDSDIEMLSVPISAELQGVDARSHVMQMFCSWLH